MNDDANAMATMALKTVTSVAIVLGEQNLFINCKELLHCTGLNVRLKIFLALEKGKFSSHRIANSPKRALKRFGCPHSNM